ncbi:MAG TPA: cupin domain-containing protein [Solirubrobacteraceae bacterium]|nr:cupin domain-containing protein [Solirubrobacteraceae bacterium]
MWLHNPATGELACFDAGLAEADGRRLDVDLWLQPGAALARPHVHDHFVERFEVRDGVLGVQVAGEEGVARAGDAPVQVPAGTVHDWWNAGDGVARVHVLVEATPAAPGRPAARFVAMIEALWSLGALGRVNASGTPGPLWLAAIAHEYRDAIRFSSPSGAVLRPLAAVARRAGRDPGRPELTGSGAACVIADPGEAGLAELLARPVSTRAARGRG